MNLEEMSGFIVSKLTKNQNITVLGVKYYVKTITKKQIILVSDGVRIPIQIYKTCYHGNNAVNNFFRSIESDLVLDSINKYNPLHDISDSTIIYNTKDHPNSY